MPKYWGETISHTGDSPKWVKSKRRREKKKEKRGPNDVNNNGQAMHGARKPPGPIYAAMNTVNSGLLTCIQC